MSPAQVKNVEEIVNNVINKNQEIYAKEASLAVAKTIQVSIFYRSCSRLHGSMSGSILVFIVKDPKHFGFLDQDPEQNLQKKLFALSKKIVCSQINC